MFISRSPIANVAYKLISQFSFISYESLVTQIGSASTPESILELYQTHKHLFKTEHTVLTLRMLGRYSRQVHDLSAEYKSLLQELSNSLNTSLDDVSDFDLIDLLFWMRRFKQSRLPLNLKVETSQAFNKRISESIEKNIYSFRNLVNIFYDTTLLGRSNDACLQELINIIKEDVTQLTPFSVLQIYQACALKNKASFSREWILLDTISQNLASLIDEYDVDQKTQLFKHMATLEFQYNFPNFRLYSVQYEIRKQLLQNLEQLSETSVLNIVTAYQSLPSFFPFDLINEIKEMVVVTLQNNPSNLKTNFLLDFIVEIQKLQRRRLTSEQLGVIQREIAKRILEEEESVNLEKVSRSFSNSNRNEELIQALKEKVQPNQMNTIEYLTSQKVDLSEIVSQVNVDSLNIYNLCKYYSTLKNMQNQEEQLQKVEEMILKSKTELAVISASQHINDKELMFKIAQKLKDLLENSDKNIFSQFKLIFMTCVSREIKDMWLKFFEQKETFKQKVQWYRIMDQFDQIENIGYETISLMFTLVKQHSETVNLFRFLGLVKYSDKICHDLNRNEMLLKFFCQNVQSILESQNIPLRLHQILSVILKLESYGLRSNQFKQLLSKSFDSQKDVNILISLSSQRKNIYIEMQFINHMAKYNCLSQEHAQKALDTCQYRDLHFKAKLLRIAYDENETKYDQLGTELAAEFSNRLKSEKVGFKLMALPSMLALPYKFAREHLPTIESMIRSSASEMNFKVYMLCIQELNVQGVLSNRNEYQGIIKELASQYNDHNKRMSFGECLIIMEKFNQLRVHNTQIYNSFLNDVANYFMNLSPEYRIRSMQVFAQQKIKQPDFFIKNLEKIVQQPFIFRNYISNISNILYRVGLNDDVSFDNFTKLIKGINNLLWYDRLNALLYFTLFPIEKTKDLIQQLADQMAQITQDQNIKKLVTIVEYLNANGMTELSEQLKSKMESNQYQRFFEQQFGNQKREFSQMNNICQYLDSMKVQYESNKIMDGFQLDLVIPEQKIILVAVIQQNLNFDKTTFTGFMVTISNILQAKFKDYKVVPLNLFNFKTSGRDHINKVDFLLEAGIKSNVSGDYDFSNIQVEKKIQDQEETEQVEELIDESVVLEAEEEVNAEEKK